MYFVSTMGDNKHQLVVLISIQESISYSDYSIILLSGMNFYAWERRVPEPEEITEIKKRIQLLEAQMADLEDRLPAHSIPPSLIAALDVLDEQIHQEKNNLKALQDKN